MPWVPTGDADAIHDNVAGEIAAITEKTTPVSADLLLIEDSAASNAKKRVQVGNLPSGGGGGGAAHIYQAARPPATPDAFDEEFDTDPTAGWTWLNQSTASVTVDTANSVLTLHDNRNVNNASFIGKAPPSGDWTIETVGYPWMADVGGRSGGFLAVRYGSTINVLGFFQINQLRTLTYSSNGAGAVASQTVTPFGSMQHLGLVFLRASWNDTAGTLSWLASYTGAANSWFTMHSFSPGATPDLVGFAATWERGYFIAYPFEYLRRIA